MKIILQRCASASVSMDNNTRSIQQGYILLLGVMAGDNEADADKLIQKILHLRLFSNKEGKINDRSIQDIAGDILLVSQFTLAGSFKKGNRPDYTAAMEPQQAKKLYEYATTKLKQCKALQSVQTGEFGAHMEVKLVNDGPVTLVLDSTCL